MDDDVLVPAEPPVAGGTGVGVGGTVDGDRGLAAIGTSQSLIHVVGDVEGEEGEGDTNVDSSEKENSDPWPHIEKFYKFSTRDGMRLVYFCKLCTVKTAVSCHTTTKQNLKSHMTKKHRDRFIEFEELLRSKSRRGQHSKKRKWHTSNNIYCKKTSPLTTFKALQLLHCF